MRLNTYFGWAVAALCLAACGGNQKPAEEPPAASGEAAAEAEAPKAAEKASAEPEKAEESSSSGPTIKRTAKDIVTMPDVIFMFSFNESDVRQGAEERCDKVGQDDPKKRAECMTKEKSKIEADGIQFKQEKGDWYWITVKRKGAVLTNLHKLPIEFKDETDTSITVKPTGKDEGTLRGKGAPGETKIEVPNDYQIVLTDPTHGRMVYEAKLGLVGEQQR